MLLLPKWIDLFIFIRSSQNGTVTRTMDVVLGPGILAGNRVEALQNGDDIVAGPHQADPPRDRAEIARRLGYATWADYRTETRMTGSAADADEIVQETFQRVLEKPPRDTKAPLKPWLVKVAVNQKNTEVSGKAAPFMLFWLTK